MHNVAPLHGSHWQRRFFTIWSGQALSLFGSALVQFALIWWLTATTGSATVLATATLMATLPQVLLSPLVGALVDRWNRRVIMIVSDSLIALCTLVLALLFASESVQIWHVYALLMLRSLGAAFHGPAMQASTTLMVPERHYARVAGIAPLSLLVAGPVADAIGVQSWFVVAGVACLVAVAYGASNQALMNLESGRATSLVQAQDPAN